MRFRRSRMNESRRIRCCASATSGSRPGTRGTPRSSQGAPRRSRLLGSKLDSMSAQREELHQLVDDLPDEQVPAALAELRARASRAKPRPWPPSWFGASEAREPDVSERVDEILHNELGRRPA